VGDAVAAVRVARRAAAHARAQLAYEAAITLLECALDTCDEHGVDERERAEVALALGWATTEAGKLSRGRELFREAARIARCTDDSTLLARAALGQGGEYVLAEIRTELVDALREALAALGTRSGDEPRRLRARLLARLAAALTPSGTPEEPLGYARQAVAMTKDETDIRTRIDVDVGVGAALMDFAPPGERISVNERLFAEARRVSDRVLELRALTRLACDHIERGDVARCDATISARGALAESIGHPRYLWQTPLLRSMQAMPHGRFDACEAHILEAKRLAVDAPDSNAERCIEFHRFALLLLAGRPDALRAQEASAQRTLISLLGNELLHAWLTAVVAAKVGDKQRAAATLRAIGATRSMARMPRITLLEVAVLAEVRDTYERLYTTFDATDDANACWGPFAFVCTAPIARVLAAAAFALGRAEEATGHCERALALANRMDADAHRAWVHLTWGEGTGATDHLESAVGLADRLDMPEVRKRAEAAMTARSEERTRVARSPSHREAIESPVAAVVFRRDDDRLEWTIESAGRSFRLKDIRGLGMLAELIDQPGREIHALDLASASGTGPSEGAIDLGDAGEVIDLRARDAYRKRIADLREELAEAESWRDDGRAARLRDEVDALTQQIAAAVGLGGRERRSGSAAERARIAVQRRIREAIKKIAEQDADLGRHLDWTVRTGTFCAYEPRGRKSAR
jgi:tetratricopeptide (TPR) repeat protein